MEWDRHDGIEKIRESPSCLLRELRVSLRVEEGSVTVHPSGLPHGPQPGLVEKSLGARRTEELAVMWDTFRPLRLTPFARELDDPRYAYSWREGAPAVATTTTG